MAKPDPGETRLTPVRHRAVTKQVVDALFNLLRSGEYREGDRLPSEWELVAQLKVGRSAVREAIRELSALGLVDVLPGKGTYVNSLRPDLLFRPERFGRELDRAVSMEMLEVRLIIEPRGAALAAARATANELDRLHHDVDAMSEAVHEGFRPPEDLGFHLDVVRATHNRSLARLASAIVSYYEHDRMLPTDRDVREHAEILQAIESRAPERAEAAMRIHLEDEITVREKSELLRHQE